MKRSLNLDQAFERLHVYLPVALEATGTKNLYKLYNKVLRVVDNQPLEDVTVALAITLADVVNYWHKKQKHPLRKQRKAAKPTAQKKAA